MCLCRESCTSPLLARVGAVAPISCGNSGDRNPLGPLSFARSSEAPVSSPKEDAEVVLAWGPTGWPFSGGLGWEVPSKSLEPWHSRFESSQ